MNVDDFYFICINAVVRADKYICCIKLNKNFNWMSFIIYVARVDLLGTLTLLHPDLSA